MSDTEHNFSPCISGPQDAVARVPAGRWGVGVSGGADSVALLELLRSRADLQLHVVHLDHETRRGESGEDAAFVRSLCLEWGLTCTIARRSDVEPPDAWMTTKNRSARFRQARLALFRGAIRENRLGGIILAHHADDQAETILQRLLRGSGPAGLTGTSGDSVVSGVRILRPLLGVRRDALRAVLRERSISWREDSSNAMMNQLRNRVRRALAQNPGLISPALELGAMSRALTRWLRDVAPVLEERFEAARLRDVALPIAMVSARDWLAARAGPGVEFSPGAVARLVAMASDAATAPRQDFPGKVWVVRRGGTIWAGDPGRR